MKKINLFDLMLLITIILSACGFALAKNEQSSLNKVINGKEKIGIVVFLSDVQSKDKDLFKEGEKTAITIRNRPYTKLKIVEVKSEPRPRLISDAKGDYKIIDDPVRTDIRDYTVTLADTALVTEDGYVIGGNKIKIGNSVELEGFSYRLTGKVVNVLPLSEIKK